MRKKIIRILISVFFLLIISVGAATWILSGVNQNSNSINHELSNDTVELNIHYRTQSSEVSTSTEYYIPKTFTINHGVTPYNSSGQIQTDKLTNSGYDSFNADEITVFWDVVDGKYTKINQRSNTTGPEQIKSLSVNVSEWTQVSDSTSYAEVWDTSVQDDRTSKTTQLRFQCDSGNSVSGHGQMYSVGDVYDPDKEIYNVTEETEEAIITTIIYQRIVVDALGEVQIGTKEVSCVDVPYKIWLYYVRYEQRMVKIIQTKAVTKDVDTEEVIYVKKNSTISAVDLNIGNYTNYGYYADSEYNEYFDFKQPISENTDIYLRYIDSSESISNQINGMATNATTNLYDQYLGGSGGQIDISTDPSYHNPTNSVFIDSFTVNEGNTVNLTFYDSKSYLSPNTGMVPSDTLGSHRTTTDTSIVLDYDGANYIGNSNISCNIKLNGDVTVYGTLVVGAEVGSHTTGTQYSFIIGKYSVLDLHGHTLIVDGGTLTAYGLITDSIGGGKIIVNNNGVLSSVVTVTDGRGRDPSSLGITKRQAPFTEYKLSYLDVPVYIYNGSSFNGILKADFAQFGIVNLTIPFLGSSFNNYMFSWATNNAEEYILYKPSYIKELYTVGNTTEYLNMYYFRNQFHFFANVRQAGEMVIQAKLETTAGNVDVDIDFARIDFPISPFFDFIINSGYYMEINSKMTFYPGSSMYVAKGARLDFKYYKEQNYASISKTAIGIGITLPGEKKYIAGGLMTYTNKIQDLATYSYSKFNVGVYYTTNNWKYTKESYVIIDGDITFDSNIDTSKSDGYYYLSGNITLSSSGLNSIIQNKNCIKTYDMKSEIRQAFLYDSNNYSLEKQYTMATSYNINPIISGDRAYIIDKNNLLIGTFDKSNGVFTEINTSNKYILKTDNDMYEDGSSGSDQDSRVDRNVEILQISFSNSEYKIVFDSNNTAYLYYCGLFVPVLTELPDVLSFVNNSEINVNARKFMSNKDASVNISIRTITVDENGTPTTSNAVSTNISQCFSNLTLRYSTSSKNWSYYCFGDYPKTGTETRYSY